MATSMRGTRSMSRGPGRTSMRGRSGGMSLRGASPVSAPSQRGGFGIGGQKVTGAGDFGRGVASQAPSKRGGFTLPPTLDGHS